MPDSRGMRGLCGKKARRPVSQPTGPGHPQSYQYVLRSHPSVPTSRGQYRKLTYPSTLEVETVRPSVGVRAAVVIVGPPPVKNRALTVGPSGVLAAVPPQSRSFVVMLPPFVTHNFLPFLAMADLIATPVHAVIIEAMNWAVLSSMCPRLQTIPRSPAAMLPRYVFFPFRNFIIRSIICLQKVVIHRLMIM